MNGILAFDRYLPPITTLVFPLAHKEASLVTHIAALSNDKGGVAKSQTTVQLAAALARQKKRVLVVDLDPQANATRRLGITWDPEDPFPTTSEIIKENSEGVGQGAVLQCGWTLEDEETPTAEAKYIDLIPSRYDLVNRDGEANQIGALRRLKRALDGWLEPYDFVLIDTQPSLGHLTQMAFAAADTVVIPTSASYDGAEGAIRVSDFVEQYAVDLANPDLKIGGVVITMFNGQQNEDRHNERGLTKHFGDLVWKLTGSYSLPNGEKAPVTKYIGKKVRYAEADGAGVSLSAYKDKDSRLTVAVYDALAKAYIKRFGKTSTKEKAA